MVAALAVAVERLVVYSSFGFGDVTFLSLLQITQFNVDGLLALPFSVPGCLLLIGLVRLLERRSAPGLVATAGAAVPVVYAIVGSGRAYHFERTPLTILLQVLLLVLLLAGGATAIIAGRQGPRAQPVAVMLGAGAALYLLVSSVTVLLRLGLLLLGFLPLADMQVGPWLTVRPGSDFAPDGSMPPAVGIAVALAVLGCAVLALRGLATRRRPLSLAAGLGAAGTLSAYDVASWVVAGDSVAWTGSRELSLLFILLESVLLVGMAAAVAVPGVRGWFASGPGEGLSEGGDSSPGPDGAGSPSGGDVEPSSGADEDGASVPEIPRAPADTLPAWSDSAGQR